MKNLIAILFIFTLSACVTTPDFNTGAGCWRFGVSEQNTGRMTHVDVDSIPVTKLGYEDLLTACGVEDNRSLAKQKRDGNTMVTRGCYSPNDNHIYLYKWAGEMELDHERCHAVLGTEHNSCNGAYAQFGDTVATACEWDFVDGHDPSISITTLLRPDNGSVL